VNPYESPTADCGDTSLAKEGDGPRSPWLVRISLLLAIFCEVIPLEADAIFIAYQPPNVILFVAIKSVFLTVILAPLFVYVALNGWRGLRFVKGRACAIGIIVSVILILQGAGLVAAFQR
jgi:hypothetical protein